MKYLIFPLLYIGICPLFTSCTISEPITPPCPNIEIVSIEGERVRFKIISNEPETVLYWSDGHTLTVQSHYYGCVTIRIPKGETVTVNKECTIQ